MKTFLRIIFITLFIISSFWATVLYSFKSTIFSYNFISQEIQEHQIYENIYTVGPKIAKDIMTKIEQQELTPGEKPPVSIDQMISVVVNSVDKSTLQNKSETFLKSFYNWLYDPNAKSPMVDLSDIRGRVLEEASRQTGFPVAMIDSGEGPFNVPSKIELSVPVQINQAHQVFSNYSFLLIILLTISIISLALVPLLKSGNLRKKLKSFSTPPIISAIFISMFAGTFWLFFNAGNLLYKIVLQKVGAYSEDATKIIFSFSNDIVNAVVIRILTIAAVMFGVSILIKICTLFLEKENNKSEKQEKVGNDLKTKETNN